MVTIAKDDAQAIHAQAHVVDAAVTLLQPESIEQDLAEARAAGIDLAFVTVGLPNFDFRRTVENISKWYQAVNDHSQDLALITSVAEFEDQVVGKGKVGIMFHFQGSPAFDGDLKLVEVFYRLGVRVIGLTYNERNLVGDGCTERTNIGLSDFGVSLIEELNRLKMLIDLSHVGPATSTEAIEVSASPVAFTHSNCKALHEHPRNISDDHIRAVAVKGGVVGINVFPDFVGGANTVDDVMNHVDHVVKLVGIDHVGLGLDLNTGGDLALYKALKFKEEFYSRPPWNFPEGIKHLSEWPNLTEKLLSKGYALADVEKILGGNFLRLLREVFGN